MPTLTHPSPADAGSPVTADPLAGLRDIHLPEDVSTLPLAPGWWVLAALLIAGVLLAWLASRRRQARQRYRREGAALLNQLPADLSAADQLQGINQLLKRVALAAYPHSAVAGYHGRQWLAFLQQAAPAVPQPAELAEILTAGVYAPAPEAANVTVLQNYAREWINHHLPEQKSPQPAEVSHAAL